MELQPRKDREERQRAYLLLLSNLLSRLLLHIHGPVLRVSSSLCATEAAYLVPNVEQKVPGSRSWPVGLVAILYLTLDQPPRGRRRSILWWAWAAGLGR